MPVRLPELDDRRYDDLVEEARALIPNLCPEWTDHNPTDPGITLIELLAWLTEMVIYRLDQIPTENYEAFLKLLDSTSNAAVGDGGLEEGIRRTVRELRKRHRAATGEDYEEVVLRHWPEEQAAKELEKRLGKEGTVRRVHCLPNCDLDSAPDHVEPLPGHISVIVVPDRDSKRTSTNPPTPDPQLLGSLWYYLDERRLLTVRHHVVGPRYRRIAIAATLHLKPDAPRGSTKVETRTRYVEAATQCLHDFFDPVPCNGSDGWMFGRDVYLSEIFEAFGSIENVDYVDGVMLNGSGEPDTRVALRRNELVHVETLSIKIEDFAGMPLNPPEIPTEPEPEDDPSGKNPLTSQPDYFDWSHEPGVSYDIYIDGHAWDRDIDSRKIPWRRNRRLSVGDHSWHVEAKNSFGKTSGPEWKFTIKPSNSR